MKKRILCMALAIVLCLSCLSVLAACDPKEPGNSSDTNGGTQGGNNTGTPGSSGNNNDDPGSNGSGSEDETDPTGRYSKFDLRASYDIAKSTTVTFTDSAASVTGTGAKAEGTTVVISGEGTYILSGSCSDGQVIVEVKDKDKVQLVFNGLKLASKTKAPLWIKNADKVSITLADGTVNTLEDTAAYTDANADGEPNACLFSKDDLTINGTGTLNVVGNVNNGITTKDDLKIVSGTINVTAKNHGIRGNDSVSIRNGNITISCGNDGIKSSKEDKDDKGYIYIEGGEISIDAGDDCLQAPIDITVTGGTIKVAAGGKTVNSKGTANIADGVLVNK